MIIFLRRIVNMLKSTASTYLMFNHTFYLKMIHTYIIVKYECNIFSLTFHISATFSIFLNRLLLPLNNNKTLKRRESHTKTENRAKSLGN